MLSVPLPVELSVRQPEVRREVYDQTGPRLEQPRDSLRALAVPVGDEGDVKIGGFYLLGRNVRSINGELRVNLADSTPHIPPRRNLESTNLGVAGEQPYELDPRIPTPPVDSNVQSHAANCRTSGYLFKYLHKPVDALSRGCENRPHNA